MKKSTFFREVVVALTLSCAGSVLYVSLSQIVSPITALKSIIGIVALCYSGYLLARCRVMPGRVTIAVTWFLVAAACWFGNLTLSSFLLIQVGMIWVIRSLFYHRSPVGALLDLLINALSVFACVWAMVQSESLFMSLWCCFLVQALFVFIPAGFKPLATDNRPPDRQFQRAHQAAQAAIVKLSSVKSSVRS
jgi:hypothetical protein